MSERPDNERRHTLEGWQLGFLFVFWVGLAFGVLIGVVIA